MTHLPDWIRDADSTVFFGGAGVSTESGIPDFRSAAGLYTRADGRHLPPEYLLSIDCLDDSPEDFFDYYVNNLIYPDAQPNAGHRALAALERAGLLSAVITQNIDGLHQAAGSRTVIELHGSVHRNYCMDCGRRYGLATVLAAGGGIPRCEACGGIVRPDVVLYGEPLDTESMTAAALAVQHANLMIIGGTSLNVYPAAGYVQAFSGEHLVIVNRDPTPMDRRADEALHEALGPVLTRACEELGVNLD